jgi:hypothetical protein
MWRRAICGGLLALVPFVSAAPTADAAVAWTWPVIGPVVRGFDPPDDPYGAGHRGIDIAADLMTVIVAPDDGVVTFAGKVGGKLFLTIDHGGSVSSTCSWLTQVMVRKGDHVVRGQSVATTAWGHPELPMPHLHFGVRLDGTYVDPLDYLGLATVSGLIRLAPIATATPAARFTTGRMTGLAYPTVARAVRAGGAGARLESGRRGAGGRHRLAMARVPGQRAAQRGRPRRIPGAAVRGLVERRGGHR